MGAQPLSDPHVSVPLPLSEKYHIESAGFEPLHLVSNNTLNLDDDSVLPPHIPWQQS
jgi:hypothetical protein